ncbi:DUF6660 family protein [Seonamhaeicola sp. ML3]|uniref:DUF6660 family protein n=1 Tax=Seonamhaeicola sp. ML3 TaxID=2937786 RepID=UPI003530693A
MRFITIILSLTMLFLSIQPCSDGQNLEDHHQGEISVNHNHQEDSDDSCPVTCICNCCGIAITYEPLDSYDFILQLMISTELISSYQFHYRLDVHPKIWQPPQVIS